MSRPPKTNIKRGANLPSFSKDKKQKRITPTQYLVVELLSQGLTRIEIANSLHIEIGTVRRHISDAIKKTHSKTAISMCIKIFKKKYKII